PECCGEERFSRRIARSIKNQKSLPNSTLALANRIAQAIRGPRSRIHPATRTFQALRIAVNQELKELDTLLLDLESLTHPGSRIAFLSFHSLEDRRIKQHLRNQPHCWRALTKKPVTASETEMHQNPRAQSAKLRIGERI
ncbi:MAG: 16S rRNA (cytosine(1402)-N(4))-methyltransferase, partial [Myxococcaceae bacterium]|nr:16S rRNA (cytosine(1402)-N(4))-methyltransferase [Myxococcaceae bacterium]